MRVRGVIKPRKGSSTTTVDGVVSTAPAVSPLGAPAVTAFVKVYDAYDSVVGGIGTVLATLTLSPSEARELAERLTRHAAEAEALAGLPKICPVCQDGACETKSAECGK